MLLGLWFGMLVFILGRGLIGTSMTDQEKLLILVAMLGLTIMNFVMAYHTVSNILSVKAELRKGLNIEKVG